MPRIVRITLAAGTVNARVSFGYDPELIALVKTFRGARWVPADKVWTVPARHIPQLELDLKAYSVHVISTRPADAQPPGGDPFGALLDLVGERYAEPVTKALLRILHPDIGGDTALTQQLLAARERRHRDTA